MIEKNLSEDVVVGILEPFQAKPVEERSKSFPRKDVVNSFAPQTIVEVATAASDPSMISSDQDPIPNLFTFEHQDKVMNLNFSEGEPTTAANLVASEHFPPSTTDLEP